MLTYADANYQHTWDALEAMCDLFHRLALEIAAQFGFDYPHDDERRVWAHLKYVRMLPRDAKTMYE